MIILSIGSNLPSIWGDKFNTLKKSILELKKQFITIIKISSPYFSNPMDFNNKKNKTTYKSYNINNSLNKFYYINMNLIIYTHKPPNQLLYCIKKIEKKAGRVINRRWSNRPLDIDIICYKKIIFNKNIKINQNINMKYIPLFLPHPGITKRAFILDPLIEIAPNWHHPINGKTAKQLKKLLK